MAVESLPLAGARLRAGAALRTAALVWREARPVVQIMFVLRFLAGAALAAGNSVLSVRTLAGLVTWSAAVCAVYLRNGVADVVEDRRNGSTRPVAAGRLDAGRALTIARSLAAGSIVASALLDPRAGLLAAAMVALGWAYSAGRRPLKGSVAGFALIVIGGGLLTYLAGALLAHGRWSAPAFCFGLVMSLWMATAGSSKDLSDVEGDRAAGRRSLPVLLGPSLAAAVIAGATLALAAGFVAVAVLLAPALRLCAAVLATGAAVTAVALLGTPPAAGRARRRRAYRAFMATQYATHLGLFVNIAASVI
ncbi:UbiA family prenyltransferase [Dactylosporangium sp. CA-092794]|uniref:UbiA family prenyltransferase n=1 Tax=Dactylosporangium sp. CA-092794 TaxID=3239929 RepID=UPI003D8DB2CF